MNQLENERKFIVKDVPKECEVLKVYLIEQSYLQIDKDVERRVRKKGLLTEDGVKNIKYVETCKKGVPPSRGEENKLITQEEYEFLTPTNSIPIYKKRTVVKGKDDLEYEVDKYLNVGLDELMVVEVEFDTEEDMVSFVPPMWFGIEVTRDPRFKNSEIWQQLQKRLEI